MKGSAKERKEQETTKQLTNCRQCALDDHSHTHTHAHSQSNNENTLTNPFFCDRLIQCILFHLNWARESEREEKCAPWEGQGRELLKVESLIFYKRKIVPFRAKHLEKSRYRKKHNHKW